ncbi:DsbA family oxidoreductase [Acinetobacter bereziniae]|jgi:predicted DsbA family dithiol-disulfide isomerase|uniref:DsbA family oxidoreductase n=1 Tax=Acinetobacter bereziniae TaxID=106648 RepID=UPI00125EA30B|nr:DsbA family protein [Acinetobacter bereziniae]MCU4418367.1 DsbA family protein [Acinetobacter bereziniae]MDM1784626.1 DsbA family protein [Acinetobacter bereziniae]
MKIEFVFDIVYPMSYVAFEKLKQHWNQPTAKKIELLPVQVLPEIPEQGLDIYQYLTEKYGTKEANRKLDMAKFAAYSQDLTVDIEHMKRMPNSRLAHQAILALDNVFDQFALTQALFHAIFAHGKDIANPEVLKQVIEGMGLDGNKVLRSIQHKEVADKQAEITHYVQSFGKHPTPYYLVDGEIWDKTFDTLELKELIIQRAKDVA